MSPPEMLKPIMMGYRTYGPQRPPARPFTDDELRSVGLPVLALLAERSVLIRPDAARERLERLVAGVRVEIVPKVGHGLPLENPGLVNRRILQYIEREAPAPSA
ncbi:alpha/beta fold hydrolase [Actinomadura algeriensis]|uniref:Pimeloyl-ACP methyl ester carboxylesterase n=1 Tax=Actinomadura algeriensis TaxID=1679523 RepID=A0ABR9JPX6_9ACTN|nr:alpha/beta hydrolase [Actinomadura algeriensis]MBE1532625.1 pimeloyl-ACP methyl ester carboxylesterase [Actinomadura algeriensis]